MFRLESLNFVTCEKEMTDVINFFKENENYYELSFIVNIYNDNNENYKEEVSIVLCDDSYCLNVEDFRTKENYIDDMYFEELEVLTEYLVCMYFDSEERYKKDYE